MTRQGMHCATKWLALALIGAVLLTAGRNVRASGCESAFQERRITIVVPYPAGGGHDQYARALAPVLQRIAGARVSVSNLPAAGGVAGAKAVADGDTDNPRLGIFEPALVLDALRRAEPSLDRFVALGSMAAEVQAWTARPGFDPVAPRDRPAVASVSDLAANVIEVAMVAQALGIPVRMTAGYKGSGDRFAAILRGEVDFTANSATTALKAARGGDLKQALVISDTPHPQMPGVPWLAGRGGLVERITADKPAAVREEAMRIARQAVDLTQSVRVVFAASRLPLRTRECLGELVERALFSPEFAQNAAALGREVEPRDRRAAQALIGRMREGAEANRALLRRLLEAAAR